MAWRARTLGNAFLALSRCSGESPRVRLLSVSESLFRASLDLYASRPDKSWGLVDCASFLVMQEHEIGEVVTNDRHFEQAGFKCLLPS